MPASDFKPPIATIVSVIDGHSETARMGGTCESLSPRRRRGPAAAAIQYTSRHLQDVAARDLALLLRSRHPLISCETVEEQRFETLLREVSSSLGFPYWSWSA